MNRMPLMMNLRISPLRMAWVFLLFLLQVQLPSLAQVRDKATKAQTPPELELQIGHGGDINALTFSPDGKLIASADIDSNPTVKLWEVKTGRVLRTLPITRAAIAIKFSPDGQTLAIADWNFARTMTIILMDVVSWRELRRLTLAATQFKEFSLAFNPDGRWLAAVVEGTKATHIWETATGREVQVLPVGDRGLAFSPDGRWLVVGDLTTIRIWTVENWQEARVIDASAPELGTLSWNQKLIDSLVINSDSRYVIVGGYKQLRAWEIATGRKLDALSRDNLSYHVETSNDGHRFAFREFKPNSLLSGPGKYSIRVWDADTLQPISHPTLPLPAGLSFALNPSGLLSASVSKNGQIQLLEVATGRETQFGTRDPLQGTISFSPDGRWLALGSSFHGRHYWDTASGQRVLWLQNPNHWKNPEGREVLKDSSLLASRPEARLLMNATSPSLAEAMRVWLLQTTVGGEQYSSDGRLRADRQINGDIVLKDGATLRQLRILQGHTKPVLSFKFSPDGKTAASAGGVDGTVRLWDVASGEEKWKLAATPEEGYRVDSVSFGHNGKYLVASISNLKSYGNLKETDPQPKGWISISNAKSGELVRKWELNCNPSRDLVFSKDDRQLYVAEDCWDGSRDHRNFELWDIESGKKVRTILSSNYFLDVALSPLDKVVVAADFNSTSLWNPKTGALLATVFSPNEGSDWLVTTPDGLFDGSPGGWNQVLWRFNNNTFDTAPVEAFFNEYYYPGLLAEILAGKTPKAKVDISRKDRRQPQLKLNLATGKADAPLQNRQLDLQLEVQEAPANAAYANGSGVRDVRLFRNGSLVKVWRGDLPLDKSGHATLEAPVTLVAGENKFNAYAFNRDNIKSPDASLTLTGAESLKRRGTAYILAVGLNHYANPAYDLQFAVADAQAVTEQVSQLQTQLGSYGKVETVLLRDAEATKANILRALARLSGDITPLPDTAPAALQQLQPAQPEDAVLVYYAGHGTAAGPRFYLIPHDLGYGGSFEKLDAAGMNTMLGHSVSDLELQQAFERIDAGQLLLVIDACNSGQALEAEEKRRGPMNSAGLAQLAYEKGMNVLTAAQGYQAAIEATQYGHGLLTYALVEEGLKTDSADTQPKDGQIVVREWLDYATQRVPQVQEKLMQDFRKVGRNLAFVEGEQKIEDLADRSLQRPRVFYRREPEARPLVMARPGGVASIAPEPAPTSTPNLFESLGKLFKGGNK